MGFQPSYPHTIEIDADKYQVLHFEVTDSGTTGTLEMGPGK